ncbi:LppX_LprAFG lipoprotein [Nonomuraea sp. NPDC059194]|uniref:LppX_LprAFG lipoprotein n=1 Tax=Nonomuraea sp. NPDC059194 TaxID=3346764 RepID=UPI003698D4AA
MLRKLLLVVLALALTACSSRQDLPEGAELVNKAATAMKAVKSASFSITTDGVPKIQLKKADGRLTATGEADGTLQVSLMNSLQEFSFVMIGDTVHFKATTGGYQKMPKQLLMAGVGYDPSTLLDPDKGISALLGGLGKPATEAEDDGSYRVAATFPGKTMGTLIPGVTADINGKLWIDTASSRLTRIELPLDGGSVTVTLSDYDAPITITPPAG